MQKKLAYASMSVSVRITVLEVVREVVRDAMNHTPSTRLFKTGQSFLSASVPQDDLPCEQQS